MLVFHFDINGTITITKYKDNVNNIKIFPSFMKVLKEFPDSKIIFRTYGRHRDYVLKSFPGLRFIKLEAVWVDDVCYYYLKRRLVILNDLIFTLGKNQHILIKEDHKAWSSNGKSLKYGKLIYHNDKLKQIGFDDHECMCVVDYSFDFKDELDKYNESKNYKVDNTLTNDVLNNKVLNNEVDKENNNIEELYNSVDALELNEYSEIYDNNHVVIVNTEHASTNDNYYVDIINNLLSNNNN